MESRSGAIRYLIIFINVLYLLAGLSAVAVGLWIFFTNYEIWRFGEVVQYSEGESLRNFWLADIIFIAGGVAVIVFGFTAVCGVFARNACMWAFQSVCFLLTIGVHVAALVFVIQSYAQHAGTQTAMRNEMFQMYDGVANNEYSKAFDEVQKRYECCGVSGLLDFTADMTSFQLYASSLGTLRSMPPRSCADSEQNPFLRGCHQGLEEALFKEYVSILVISCVSIFCAMLLFVLSICLCVRYKETSAITHL